MMKRIIYLLLILALPTILFGQSNQTIKNVKVTKKSRLIEDVVIGDTDFEESAILTITSSSQGMLAPRMNTAARDGIGSPADGLLIFNNQTNQYEFFETTWKALGAVDGNIFDNNGTLNSTRTLTQNEFNLTIDGSGGGGKLIIKENTANVLTLNSTTANSSIDYQTNDGVFKVTTGFFTSSNGFEIAGGSLVTGFNIGTGNIAFGAAPTTPNHPFIVQRNSATQQTILWNNTLGNELHIIRSLALSKIDLETQALASTGGIWSDATSGIRLRTNSIDRFVIGRTSGDIGIGMALTTPASRVNIRGVNAAGGSLALLVEDNVGTDLLFVTNDGQTVSDGEFSTTKKDLTLGVAAVTFATTSNVMQITGDGGGNTIATITGALSGQYLIMIFVDDKVTLTDDNGHGANTLDLSAAFSSLDDTTITIFYDGTSWYETSRSVN